MRRAVLLVILISGVAGLGTVITGQGAFGYNLHPSGCRYDPTNDDDGLGIAFSSNNYNTQRVGATVSAAGTWNYWVTPQFTLVTWGSSQRDLKVEFHYLGAGGGVAQTQLPCNLFFGYYDADPTLKWNLDITHYYTNELEITGIHEIGHSYGVNHNMDSSCNGNLAGLMYTPSVNKFYACSWPSPTVDDILGQVDSHNGH